MHAPAPREIEKASPSWFVCMSFVSVTCASKLVSQTSIAGISQAVTDFRCLAWMGSNLSPGVGGAKQSPLFRASRYWRTDPAWLRDGRAPCVSEVLYKSYRTHASRRDRTIHLFYPELHATYPAALSQPCPQREIIRNSITCIGKLARPSG